jgi:hypothetical protein
MLRSLTRTTAQAKKRIKGFFTGSTTVSGVIALANPRCIKASHRRRRRVASDHLLYILNNPLSGTDPTGYYGKFDSACDRPSMLGACDTSAGGGNATRKVNAGKANQTGNGASTGSTVTTGSRNQGDTQSIAARFGAPVLRAVLPAVDDYGRRGEPGDLGDHAYNGLAALVNAGLDGLFLMPGMQRISMDIPRMEYEAKGLKTGAVVQMGTFVVGGGRSAAARAGGLADDAARAAGQLADEVAPIIETIVVNVSKAGDGMTLFHGTDVNSATAFLRGASLNAEKAAAGKIDGGPGFYLATHSDDAAYFAARRGSGAVLQYDFSPMAVRELGLSTTPLGSLGKFGRFLGGEAVVPTSAFEKFNMLRGSGEIVVSPSR